MCVSCGKDEVADPDPSNCAAGFPRGRRQPQNGEGARVQNVDPPLILWSAYLVRVLMTESKINKGKCLDID